MYITVYINIYILESTAALRAALILVGGASPPNHPHVDFMDCGLTLSCAFFYNGAALKPREMSVLVAIQAHTYTHTQAAYAYTCGPNPP